MVQTKTKEGEGKGFFRNPDAPNCEAAFLYAVWCGQTQTVLDTRIDRESTMVADNRKVEDSEAKATKDKLKKENEAGYLLFSVLGIHVLAGRENPPMYLSCFILCLFFM